MEGYAEREARQSAVRRIGLGRRLRVKAGGDCPYLGFVTLLLALRGIHPKKFARGSREQLGLVFRREFFYRFDEFAWVGFAQGKWIVRAERDTLCAK